VIVYLDHSTPDEHDAAAHFIRGHLAVLFALLMQDSPQNQREILTSLPEPSTRSKIARLMDDIQQFDSSSSADETESPGQAEPQSDMLKSAFEILRQLAQHDD
jgi:hypothetical protein